MPEPVNLFPRIDYPKENKIPPDVDEKIAKIVKVLGFFTVAGVMFAFCGWKVAAYSAGGLIIAEGLKRAYDRLFPKTSITLSQRLHSMMQGVADRNTYCLFNDGAMVYLLYKNPMGAVELGVFDPRGKELKIKLARLNAMDAKPVNPGIVLLTLTPQTHRYLAIRHEDGGFSLYYKDGSQKMSVREFTNEQECTDAIRALDAHPVYAPLIESLQRLQNEKARFFEPLLFPSREGEYYFVEKKEGALIYKLASYDEFMGSLEEYNFPENSLGDIYQKGLVKIVNAPRESLYFIKQGNYCHVWHKNEEGKLFYEFYLASELEEFISAPEIIEWIETNDEPWNLKEAAKERLRCYPGMPLAIAQQGDRRVIARREEGRIIFHTTDSFSQFQALIAPYTHHLEAVAEYERIAQFDQLFKEKEKLAQENREDLREGIEEVFYLKVKSLGLEDLYVAKEKELNLLVAKLHAENVGKERLKELGLLHRFNKLEEEQERQIARLYQTKSPHRFQLGLDKLGLEPSKFYELLKAIDLKIRKLYVEKNRRIELLTDPVLVEAEEAKFQEELLRLGFKERFQEMLSKNQFQKEIDSFIAKLFQEKNERIEKMQDPHLAEVEEEKFQAVLNALGFKERFEEMLKAQTKNIEDKREEIDAANRAELGFFRSYVSQEHEWGFALTTSEGTHLFQLHERGAWERAEKELQQRATQKLQEQRASQEKTFRRLANGQLKIGGRLRA